MASIPEFDLTTLKRILEIMADTSTGMTGSEIGKLLGQLGIDDALSGTTKRVRMFEACKQRQQQNRCGNLVVAFIHEAMKYQPQISEQSGIVTELDALHEEVDALKRLQAETAAELGSFLPAVLDRAF